MHPNPTRLPVSFPLRPVLVGAALVLAAAPTALAGNKSWNNAFGSWSVGANWSPFGAPAPGDAVFIGNLGVAENDFVSLDVNASVASLSITDGMQLDCDGRRLLVAGNTSVAGEGSDGMFTYASSLRVEPSAFVADFVTDDLTLSDGGNAYISGGALLRVNGMFLIGDDSALVAEGTLELAGDGPVAMKVNGNFQGSGDTLAVVISQVGSGLIDLDGDLAGDHVLSVNLSKIDGSAYESITINGTALSDDFNDDLSVAEGCALTLNLTEGWTVGGNAELSISNISPSPGPATVNGGHLAMHGDIDMGGSGKHARFTCPVTLHEGVNGTLGSAALLQFHGATTVVGGSYAMGEGSAIDFNAATTWNGSVVLDGVARQNHDATVAGPTTIAAKRFDMDGVDGLTSWSIGNALTVNAESLDSTLDSTFDGTIGLEGTFLGRLTVNLDAPSTFWTMDGVMNLGGVGALLMTRVEGSEMRVTGDLNVSGRVLVTADVELAAGSALATASAASVLRVGGSSVVAPAAAFIGGGTLENATTGDLTIGTPTAFGAMGLSNLGVLRLGASAGKATVNRFACGPAATWDVEIGGHVPGIEHDFLTVANGPATLGGTLHVDVIDAGGGLFEPVPGDEFEILVAPGTLVGTFGNDPVSFVPNTVYLWTVGYSASAVTLTLDEVVPCPGDLNGDGGVDGADLGLLLAAWGACLDCDADLSGDGTVDGADLGSFLAAWGACQYRGPAQHPDAASGEAGGMSGSHRLPSAAFGVLESEQRLPGTPETVFPFFADPRNLEAITPPWLRFRMLAIGPIAMARGTEIDYRLRWRLLPIRWRTLIAEWEPPHRFVDQQVRGPYRVWRHEHRFQRSGAETVMHDRVEYLAPFSRLAHPLIVRRDVERIFAYRRAALERLFGPPGAASPAESSGTRAG